MHKKLHWKSLLGIGVGSLVACFIVSFFTKSFQSLGWDLVGFLFLIAGLITIVLGIIEFFIEMSKE